MNTKVGFAPTATASPTRTDEVKPPYRSATVASDNRCRNNWASSYREPVQHHQRHECTHERRLIPPFYKKIGSEIHYRRFNRIQAKPCLRRSPCKVTYSLTAIKIALRFQATVRRDQYSSNDQLRGKAERRAKKALYDTYGNRLNRRRDENEQPPNMVVDTGGYEIKEQANTGPAIGFDDAETVWPKKSTPRHRQNPRRRTYAAPVQTKRSGTPTTGTAPGRPTTGPGL